MSAYGGGYGTTSYGAAGGEQDGGFMWGSQGGSQSAAKPIADESLRPVTIKQIIDAEPAYPGSTDFAIDSLDIKQVTLVGMVRSISPQTTNITYKIDDGTGVIEVKQWLDADKQESAETFPQFREEDYVRVWGRLKAFNNKRHVGAHTIKPVRDFNEVSYHMLEATYVHLCFTRGAPARADAGMGPAAGAGANDNDSMFVDSGHDDKMRSYSPKARKMFQFLMNSTSPEGVNVHVISRDAGMSLQDAMAAAEELISAGTIFTTSDDETYAILEHY